MEIRIPTSSAPALTKKISLSFPPDRRQAYKKESMWKKFPFFWLAGQCRLVWKWKHFNVNNLDWPKIIVGKNFVDCWKRGGEWETWALLCIFSFPFEISYLKFPYSMPNNPDKITLLFNWFPSLLRCSLQSTSGKQIRLLGNLFLEVGRLGVGDGVLEKEDGKLPDIQQVMAGMATSICKNLHLCLNSQHKDWEKLWLPVWLLMEERVQVGWAGVGRSCKEYPYYHHE